MICAAFTYLKTNTEECDCREARKLNLLVSDGNTHIKADRFCFKALQLNVCHRSFGLAMASKAQEM